MVVECLTGLVIGSKEWQDVGEEDTSCIGYFRDQYWDHDYSSFALLIWIVGLRVSFLNWYMLQSLEVRYKERVVNRFRKVGIL